MHIYKQSYGSSCSPCKHNCVPRNTQENISSMSPSSNFCPCKTHSPWHIEATETNGRHFPDDIFNWIFLVEIVWISIKISLNFVSRGKINNIPALVQMMAWRRPRDKPLSEPIMVSLVYWHIYAPLGLNELIFHSKMLLPFSHWNRSPFKLGVASEGARTR